MKTLNKILAAAFVLLVAAGCYDDGTDFVDTAVRVTLTPDVEDFNADGTTVSGNDSFVATIIISEGSALSDKAWTASIVDTPSWVSLKSTTVTSYFTEAYSWEVHDTSVEGIEITVDSNPDWRRSFTLLITVSDGTEEEFAFEQLGSKADAYATLDPTSMTFMAEEPENLTFTLETNMTDNITITVDADWCTVTETDEDYTYNVSCEEYDSEDEDRTATITVHVGTSDTSETEATIEVTQLKKDLYVFLYGAGVPYYPSSTSSYQTTKVSDGLYSTDGIYVMDGQVMLTYAGGTYWLASDGTISATETTLDVDIDGMRTLSLNMTDMIWSETRVCVANCLPDSEVDNYETVTFTANGRTKIWMKTSLNWNGGDNIGTIKIGSRMVDDGINSTSSGTGGYTSATSYLTQTRVSEYDEVESGGSVQGLEDESNTWGRIYTFLEMLTGVPSAAVNLARLYTDWPDDYYPGVTFVDAVGKEMEMVALTSLSGCSFDDTPTLTMQVQGICPYGWHIGNVQDFYDMLCAACELKGETVNDITAMVGTWSVPDMLRTADGWKTTPTRNDLADCFGFDLYPAGRRLYRWGYQLYGYRGEMFIFHPGTILSASSGNGEYDVYDSWRISALTATASTLTINTAYQIGDAAASFRCVKNYVDF